MSFVQALLDDADACRRKMTNATALIEGLGGEKVRWTAASKGFEAQIQRLVGDVLLCTGFLSYCGPFNQEFRSLLNKSWKKEMMAVKIPFTDVSSQAILSKSHGYQFTKGLTQIFNLRTNLKLEYYIKSLNYTQ